MPANEKPPAMPVDVYFDGKREAFFGERVVENEEMQKMETKKEMEKCIRKKRRNN